MAQKPTKPATDETDELAQAEQNEVATTPTAPLELGQFNVEESPEEIQNSGSTPVLKMIFGTSELADEHPVGTWILGDYVVAKKGTALKIYVIGARHYYKEVTPYTPGVRTVPKTFPSAKAARAAGFSTEWRDGPNGRINPDYRPAVDLIVLVERPADVTSPDFAQVVGDKQYATARLYLDKTSYDKAGDPIVKTLINTDNIYDAEFELRSEAVLIQGEQRVFPHAKLVGKTPDVLREHIASAITAVS